MNGSLVAGARCFKVSDIFSGAAAAFTAQRRSVLGLSDTGTCSKEDNDSARRDTLANMNPALCTRIDESSESVAVAIISTFWLLDLELRDKAFEPKAFSTAAATWILTKDFSCSGPQVLTVTRESAVGRNPATASVTPQSNHLAALRDTHAKGIEARATPRELALCAGKHAGSHDLGAGIALPAMLTATWGGSLLVGLEDPFAG